MQLFVIMLKNQVNELSNVEGRPVYWLVLGENYIGRFKLNKGEP